MSQPADAQRLFIQLIALHNGVHLSQIEPFRVLSAKLKEKTRNKQLIQTVFSQAFIGIE